MDKCIFCNIIHHELPAKIIYEDDICIAFLDRSQTTRGHTLVIPKKHYPNFLEVDSETLQHMAIVCQSIAKQLMQTMQAAGCNIISNTNPVAGQTVMHFHIHIIPRYDEGDTFSITLQDNSENIDIDRLHQAIVKAQPLS